jgi:hypothetical protein
MRLSRLLNGRDDAQVGAAAADVAIHVMHDFIAAGVWDFVQQRHTRHDHAGGAIAALHGTRFDESVLQRMLDAFDGRDLFAGGGPHGRNARADRLAVEQDGACAALAFATSVLGAGKVEVVAQDGEQWGARIGIERPPGSVNDEFGNPRHSSIVPLWGGQFCQTILPSNSARSRLLSLIG